MVKKSISLVLLIMVMLTGCSNKPIVDNNISNTAVATAINEKNKISDNKSIPYNYVFTGFVSVNDVVNDLPTGIKVFKTQEEWDEFKSKSFPNAEMPLPVYSEGIDFTKYSLVYDSSVDAKADMFSQAFQIDSITLQNQQLIITEKELDDNLKITANNSIKTGYHRYVILVTIEKQYLQNITACSYLFEETDINHDNFNWHNNPWADLPQCLVLCSHKV